MTSGNGNTDSSQHNGESKPAQALVKTHILTHLIEGFVIQEGAEPFPVSTGAPYLSVCKATNTQAQNMIIGRGQQAKTSESTACYGR